MALSFSPAIDTINTSKAQLVHTRVINDIDTPVSAFLKAGLGKPYAFLFESVTGGEQRGRYSFFGFDPDIIWRSHGDSSEISRNGGAYTPCVGKPLGALRALQDEIKFDLPEDIPPMAAGLFGYLGYDMIRQVETLPCAKTDPIGTPDAIMIRPRIVCIFDQVAQEIIIGSPLPAGGDYAAACARISRVAADLALPVSANAAREIAIPTLEPKLGTDAETFATRVKKAKDYIIQGDIFQVVIGQRLSAPLPATPFALYRSLRRMNPSPFLYFLDFDDHQVIGSSPEILVRLRDDVVTVRPIAGTRPRGKTQAEDLQLEADLLADPKECAEHLMLLDLGRNDVGRVAKPGTVTHCLQCRRRNSRWSRYARCAFRGFPCWYGQRRTQSPRDGNHRRAGRRKTRNLCRRRRLSLCHGRYGHGHRATDRDRQKRHAACARRRRDCHGQRRANGIRRNHP